VCERLIALETHTDWNASLARLWEQEHIPLWEKVTPVPMTAELNYFLYAKSQAHTAAYRQAVQTRRADSQEAPGKVQYP
jgi:hypothetical protein